jgi:hypothetical protein
MWGTVFIGPSLARPRIFQSFAWRPWRGGTGPEAWHWHFAAARIHRSPWHAARNPNGKKSAARFFTMSSIGRMEIQSPRASACAVMNLKLKRRGKFSSVFRARSPDIFECARAFQCAKQNRHMVFTNLKSPRSTTPAGDERCGCEGR